MITAHSLTKRFGAAAAVDDLTFEVPAWRGHRLLGPQRVGQVDDHAHDHGFGRSHLGFGPDRREALLRAGLAAVRSRRTRSTPRLSILPAPARNHLRWLALTNDIPFRRVDEVLDQVGLTSVANRRAGKFSLGMSQRLGIAATLLGDPSVLLFDEPVNGLDPEGIRWVRHFLRGLAAEGRTVFVSSHLIGEMSHTADRLLSSAGAD